MKKAIIASVTLLFVQFAVFAQTPVVSTPDNAPQTKTDKRGDRKEGKKDRKEDGGWKKSTPADRAVQYSQQLKSSLSLSDEQYQKILAVNTECISRNDAARGSQDRSAMKNSREDIKTYRQAEFQKILTADQFTAYQNLNKRGGDGDDDHGKGDRGGDRGKGRGRGDGKSKGDDSKDNN